MKELAVDHVPLDVPLSAAMLHLSGETLFDDGQIVSRKHIMLMHMAGIDQVALLIPVNPTNPRS